MYYAHFGLTEPPFRITPNTEVFFAGGNRGAILEALIYAISQGEGIIKVTGEVGTGKTMLCSMLQSRLPPHIETVYLAHPSVSPEEILHAIAFELQPHDYIFAPGSRIGVVVMSSDRLFTLRPPPGTRLSLDTGRSTATLPIVGGAKALTSALK